LKHLLVIAVLCLVAPGCAGLNWWRKPVATPTPATFNQAPTLEQIISTVNANSDAVTGLRAQSASISADGMPQLKADLVLERPSNFRLRAMLTQITGTELDIGSNADLFWVWVKRGQPPAIYYAQRDQFAASAARRMIPIEPDWLVDAIGLMRFEPGDQHVGPYDRGENRWEVRSTLSGQYAGMTRVAIIDGRYGWVLAQHMYDQNGRLVASARANRHEYYPAERVSLPGSVSVSLPAASLSFQLEVPRYEINSSYGNPSQLWVMPNEPGVRQINVATQSTPSPTPVVPTNELPRYNAARPILPRLGQRRGLTTLR